MKYWHRHHKAFKEFLEEDAYKVNSEELIAYSTKNHCIRAYNNFMKYLMEETIIEHHHYVPCSSFDDYLVKKGARTYKDIITDDEFNNLCKVLDKSRDFVIIAYHTGMRFNELLSLPYSAVFENDDGIPDFMRERFEELGQEVFGYLLLRDQAKGKTAQRDDDGHIERKPLKGRREISLRDARIIPIIDELAWNIIVQNYNDALDKHDKKFYKSSLDEDYLLIDVSMNTIRRDFLKHCKKGIHALRHSFVTRLISQVSGGDSRIIKLITGHKCEKVFNRYNHIYEELAINASKKKRKKKGKLSLIKSDKKVA